MSDKDIFVPAETRYNELFDMQLWNVIPINRFRTSSCFCIGNSWQRATSHA